MALGVYLAILDRTGVTSMDERAPLTEEDFLIPGGIDDASHAYRYWSEVRAYQYASWPHPYGARAAISIVRDQNSASPKLALACSEGQELPMVVLRIAHSSDTSMTYLLREARISKLNCSYGMGGAQESQAGQPSSFHNLPVEQISFLYNEICWRYEPGGIEARYVDRSVDKMRRG